MLCARHTGQHCMGCNHLASSAVLVDCDNKDDNDDNVVMVLYHLISPHRML